MLLKDLERAEVPLQLHESRTGPMGQPTAQITHSGDPGEVNSLKEV